MYQIDDVAEFIEQATTFRLGKDMFLYHAPAEVEDCIIVFPSNDPPTLDPDTPNYLRARFQTIIRATTYDGGLTKCKQLSEALDFFNKENANILVKFCRPIYQPRIYRRSDSGVLEMSVNYEMRYVIK